jgi:hypothetical protein
VALARGQLFQAAAIALTGSSEVPKEASQYLHESIVAFRALRVEYRTQPLAMMGYVLEARSQRLLGEPAAALAALEPVLKLPPTAAVGIGDLRRLAMMEKLESLLVTDPAAATREARLWRASPEITNQPHWVGAVDWLVARAGLAEIRKLDLHAPDARLDQAAQTLRTPGVIKAAAAFERLEALSDLDERAGQTVMTRQELFAYAQLLAQVGRMKACAVYDRAAAMPGDAPPAMLALRCAQLILKNGQPLRAADLCDLVLHAGSAMAAERAAAIQLRVAALMSALPADAANAEPELRRRVMAALSEAFLTDLPIPVRRDALTAWVPLARQEASEATILTVLTEQQALVEGSPTLLYWRAMCRPNPSTSRPAATQPGTPAANEVLADLDAAQGAGQDDPDLTCRIVLAKAQYLSGPAMGDPKAALLLLRDQHQLLESSSVWAAQAADLRAQALLDLGLIDEAAAELCPATPASAPAQRPGSPRVPLRLAEALADRYGLADAAARQRIRQQALQLCSLAMSRSLSLSQNDSVAIWRGVAAAEIRVEAPGEAMLVTEALLKNPAGQADKPRLDRLLAEDRGAAPGRPA